MIAKITRGNQIGGLVTYLHGRGKAEEHTGQRVIAAGPGILDIPTGVRLNSRQVRSLGLQMDLPRALHDAHVWYREPGTGRRVEGHVWHLSLSNPVGDRRLSDVEWAEIAGDVMDRMGFSGSDGRAPCPWVAVAHGRSANGNDHIHVAVSLVREDGAIAGNYRDRVTLSKACADYESRYGLSVVAGRTEGTVPAPSRAEIEAAHRRGRPETDRRYLARQVRAAAVAADDEVDFVRHLRAAGMLVRPRYGDGGRDQVVGYSVAIRPAGDDQPIWYGGGTLARDLRLPAVRARWDDTTAGRAGAVAAWNGHPVDRPGRRPGSLAEAADGAQRAWTTLRSVPLDDRSRWATVAGDTAGVLAAMSRQLEPDRPGSFALAADTLARAAQHPRIGPPPHRQPRGELGAVASAVAGATGSGWSWFQVVTELVRVIKLIEQAQRHTRSAAVTAAQAGAARAALEGVIERSLARVEPSSPRSSPSLDPYLFMPPHGWTDPEADLGYGR